MSFCYIGHKKQVYVIDVTLLTAVFEINIIK